MLHQLFDRSSVPWSIFKPQCNSFSWIFFSTPFSHFNFHRHSTRSIPVPPIRLESGVLPGPLISPSPFPQARPYHPTPWHSKRRKPCRTWCELSGVSRTSTKRRVVLSWVWSVSRMKWSCQRKVIRCVFVLHDDIIFQSSFAQNVDSFVFVLTFIFLSVFGLQASCLLNPRFLSGRVIIMMLCGFISTRSF